MGKIIIQQQGINHVITVPNGVIHFDSPNGGTIDFEKPLLIKSMEGDPEEPIESETTENLITKTTNVIKSIIHPNDTATESTGEVDGWTTPKTEPENSGS